MTERCGVLIVRSTKCPSGCTAFHLPALVVPCNSKQICNTLRTNVAVSCTCASYHSANKLLVIQHCAVICRA